MDQFLSQLKNLRIARYEFHLLSLQDAFLPTFLGSTLRGSFGHSLKAIACTVKHEDCRRCLLVNACSYPQVFEPSALHTNGNGSGQQDPPRPFVIQPPLPRVTDSSSNIAQSRVAWGETHIRVASGTQITFGITLFGPAVDKLPYVVYAVESMARHGFGHARAPFELEAVAVINERGESAPVYRPDSDKPQMTRIAPHDAEVRTLFDLVSSRLAQLGICDVLSLLFITPTWIEVKKEVLSNVDLEQLTKRLSWRLAMMCELYGDAPLEYDHKGLIAEAAAVKTTGSNVWTHRFERYSSRQHGKAPMQGFLGETTYRGKGLRELLPLILAGEFLGVGKETAFGLGRYWCVA